MATGSERKMAVTAGSCDMRCARQEKNKTAALIRITTAAANQIGLRMYNYPAHLNIRALKPMLLMHRLQPRCGSVAAV